MSGRNQRSNYRNQPQQNQQQQKNFVSGGYQNNFTGTSHLQVYFSLLNSSIKAKKYSLYIVLKK